MPVKLVMMLLWTIVQLALPLGIQLEHYLMITFSLVHATIP